MTTIRSSKRPKRLLTPSSATASRRPALTPYYLDVTHPQANKGDVVGFLATRYDIPEEDIATIGDGPNDVLMFARSGLAIAMGNADDDVQRAAQHVTTTNDEDGFANAVERFVLAERS